MYIVALRGGVILSFFSFLFFRPFFCLTHKQKKEISLFFVFVSSPLSFFVFFFSLDKRAKRGINLWESFGERKKLETLPLLVSARTDTKKEKSDLHRKFTTTILSSFLHKTQTHVKKWLDFRKKKGRRPFRRLRLKRRRRLEKKNF